MRTAHEFTVVPLDANHTEWFGYLSLDAVTETRIAFQTTQDGFVDITSVCLDEKMAEVLRVEEEMLRQRLLGATRSSPSNPIGTFLSELRHVLQAFRGKVEGASKLGKDSAIDAEHYRGRLRLFESVGWENIREISDDLSSVTLQLKDASGRLHELCVELPRGFPMQAPIVEADLPRPFVVSWGGRTMKRERGQSQLQATNPEAEELREVLESFVDELSLFQDFWQCMEDMDDNLWVLEPTDASRNKAACFRRFVVQTHVALIVRVNPLRPRSIPEEVRFMGPESLVQPLRTRLNQSLRGWRSNVFPRQNLEKLLNLSLPSRPDAKSEEEEFSNECGICYSFRLSSFSGAEEIPERFCDNAKCRRGYHTSCLYEWLHALPTGRAFFDNIFGECPYCNEVISVKAVR